MSNVLYRKYRPNTFEGVVGQEHIVQTLVNQIKTGKVCHAYLFCGARGVGKTSLARILAKAVNCQSIDKMHEDIFKLPCGKCDSCLANSEQSFDIIEIDGASNNGVEDARSLRETIKYLPANGVKKVYIIDEVHMLSTSAFNALLKTLEEPPDHVMFILATTEAHKLPLTVLSRCVRFDFRLLKVSALFGLLSKIFEQEGKDYEQDALRAIASYAQGSVRDALSLADTCINLNLGKLTLNDVNQLVGNDEQKIENLLCFINRADIRGALTVLGSLSDYGANMAVCAKSLAQTAKDILALKLDPNLLDTTLSRFERLKQIASDFSISFLAGIVELFIGAEGELKYAISADLFMESMVIKACKLYSLDLNCIDERLSRLEQSILNSDFKPSFDPQQPIQQVSGYNPPTQTPPDTSQINTLDLTPLNQPQTQIQTQIQPQMQSQNVGVANKQITATKLLGRLLTYFRKNSPPAMLQALSALNPSLISFSDNVFKIIADKQNYLFFCDEAFKQELDRAMLNEGLSVRLQVEKDTSNVDLEKEAEQMLSEFGNKANIIKG